MCCCAAGCLDIPADFNWACVLICTLALSSLLPPPHSHPLPRLPCSTATVDISRSELSAPPGDALLHTAHLLTLRLCGHDGIPVSVAAVPFEVFAEGPAPVAFTPALVDAAVLPPPLLLSAVGTDLPEDKPWTVARTGGAGDSAATSSETEGGESGAMVAAASAVRAPNRAAFRTWVVSRQWKRRQSGEEAEMLGDGRGGDGSADGTAEHRFAVAFAAPGGYRLHIMCRGVHVENSPLFVLAGLPTKCAIRRWDVRGA